MVQMVPPMKTTTAVRTMGIDAIFALMFRNSWLGRAEDMRRLPCGRPFEEGRRPRAGPATAQDRPAVTRRRR